MKNYRIALIGTGRVGYQFSFSDLPDNHAAAIADHPRCELVAGVNRSKEKLNDFGQRYNVSALYHDYQEMLAKTAPDICIITTHPQLHAEMVEGCAQVDSTQAIICEKPMALSLKECDRMLSACENASVLLQINHNRRWHPEWNLAKQLLEEGAIGRLNHVHFYMDGVKPAPWWTSEFEGPLLHDCTHYLDMMDYFVGSVTWLCAFAEQRHQPWAVEDFSSAFFKFADGTSGSLHASELTEYTDHGFELRGSQGILKIVGEKVHLLQSHLAHSEPESGFNWSNLIEIDLEHPKPVSTYVSALDELLNALEGTTSLRSNGLVGRRSLELVHAIYQSQLDGSIPVHLPVQLASSGVEALRLAGQFVNKEKDN